MEYSFFKKTLGAKQTAVKIAERALFVVPAYKQFLSDRGFQAQELFEQLPLSDKKNYVLAYPFEDLLAKDNEEIAAIFCSSGSSGNKFYWPQLKSHHQSSFVGVQRFLEDTFAIHQKKTLAIVAFVSGGWYGGESASWTLKNIAVNTPYPFLVYCPGNNIDEIIQIICKMNPLVEQIILLIAPSLLSYLHLKADQSKQSLPWKKLRYLVAAEPFPENLRILLQKRAGVEEDIPFMLSNYGSTDTGLLGRESVATVAMRKLLYHNHALASSLGIESPIPQFFHFIATDTFLENLDGHLCVTRWQGIPLVRYTIYDRVALYSWKELKQAILTSERLDSSDKPWIKILSNASDRLPDLIAVTGRADGLVKLGGNTLTEYVLDEAVKSEELQEILTGLYRARIVYEEDKQYLALDLEIQPHVECNAVTMDQIYYSLVQNLGRLEPRFLDMWKNVYSAWDNNPKKRILQLNLVPWPNLSQTTETTIKQRGIAR